ncbi:GMC family oxidoreductase [Streptomyces mobaraensis NBRC 13819 = DSM 40847]|uniref:Cholesterol oxidase n=1 Tax=Streptomyces mobaraensis (strain ATCC 29032 / DSM 40847 / JCM 4168 / NBRC 13819 / NCIMB 11159 / IPCR 16-22) TaxID=1223523 RepID=M3CA90_STRM1|nr:GMC oxidoreductase [Streptomyces mobaraensis]EMF00947.1 oxidoreductase [Streptomyces mobaraensis NBRC 13819 = DSM 40847]QTT72379.1 GMC family oxidoreductase [Streptomyces mobaraensis NBRC 13819 = DSM 40847]
MAGRTRRDALALVARAGLAGLGAAALGSRAAAAATRTDFRALVIGSGFGGAVAALRLGQAGMDTAVLERGREWPVAPARPVFGSVNGVTDTMFWFRRTARYPGLLPVPVRPGPGVLEVAEEPGLDIWCGAGVGGGSLVYTGVTVAPPRRCFERLYPSGLRYEEFARVWFPRARAMLGASPMPRDVYASGPFLHSRVWDRQVTRAGFRPEPLDSTFDWRVVRGELAHRVPLSATAGDSDFGCGNGAKKTLTRTYLPAALATGHVQLRPLHEVRSVGRRRDGRFRLEVRRLTPGGAVLGTEEFTCDLLFVAAGTLNTNRLLVAARDRGALPDLPAAVGEGFGDNGDQVTLRSQPLVQHGATQGSPCASGVFVPDGCGLPLRAESWVLPGFHGLPAVVTLSMTADGDHRGAFRSDPRTGRVRLTGWGDGSAAAARAALAFSRRVIAANPGTLPLTVPLPPYTAHPVGGCAIGRVTDPEGRVRGVPGLYVVDGSLLPGTVGGANPSLTITALAERALAGIVARAG